MSSPSSRDVSSVRISGSGRFQIAIALEGRLAMLPWRC